MLICADADGRQLLVIVVSNGPPADGISVRRSTGSDVRAPLLAANCTDSGWSPGAVGMATRSGTVTLPRAGRSPARSRTTWS